MTPALPEVISTNAEVHLPKVVDEHPGSSFVGFLWQNFGAPEDGVFELPLAIEFRCHVTGCLLARFSRDGSSNARG